MTMVSEGIIEQKRLRRKVSFWRIGTLLVLAGLILVLARVTGVYESMSLKNRDHIARVKISGVITNDRPLVELLKRLGTRNEVRAVILNISSPGGMAVGGEAIYDAIREISRQKPVVTSVGSLATSAGYMIASASDYIVAYHSSVIGSIGVIFQYMDTSQLLETIGVSVEEIKSSPLKAEPSPFHPASKEAKEMINKIIRDTYDWFVNLVAKRRKMSRSEVLRIADGSVFSGSQSVANRLVDAIGDEQDAKKWLIEKKDIEKSLEIVDWEPIRSEENFFSLIFGWAYASILPGIVPQELIGNLENSFSNEISGSGLVLIWKPSGS